MAIEAVEDEQQTESSEIEEAEAPEVESEADEAEEKPAEEAPDDSEQAPGPPATNAPKLTVKLDDDDEEEAPPPADKANAAWALKRKREKELERENAELRARLATPATQEAAPVLPPMPTAADPDVEFDAAKLTTKMRDWVKQEAKVEAHKAAAKAAADAAAQERATTHRRYRDGANAIKEKVTTFPDAERFVASTLSVAQQECLMEVADEPAKLVLALSQNPDVAKTLANIASLPKFTKALAEMERTMTVSPSTKKPKAPAEKIITGSGSSAPGNTALEKARALALETGDLTEVNRLKNKQKQTQKK